MSFLQQQTAWVLTFFVFPGTKSGVEGWSSQQGRKEGKGKTKKQDSHQKQTTTISKKKKLKKIKRVFQVPKYSPQKTRPQLTSFLPSHSATIFFVFFWLNLKKNRQISVLDCSMYPKKCEQCLNYYSQIWLNYLMNG
jgi:hypothetical protein